MGAPFGYTLNTLIKVRVSASNANGWGLPSIVNTVGAVGKTKPAALSPVTRGDETTEKQVQVLWSSQTTDAQTGGSPIVSYNLQWDEGTGNDVWTDLVGFPVNYLLTSYTVTAGIVKNTAYRFRLRSQNVYGFGDFSTIQTVRSSDVPDKPDAVVTSLTGVSVLFTWTAPYDNSESITEYDLQVLKADGTTWLGDLVDCPRTPPATSCSMTMDKLRTVYGLS